MLQTMISFIINRLDREEGASMVEYGLLVALIAVVVAIAATVLGNGVSELFNTTEGSL